MELDEGFGVYRWPSMTGTQLNQIFGNFDLSIVYADPDLLSRHYGMWQDLSTLIVSLHAFPGEPQYLAPLVFRDTALRYAKAWCFLADTEGNKVFPYLHVLVNHVHEFLARFGSLTPFGLQSLEFNNQEHRKTYYKVCRVVVECF